MAVSMTVEKNTSLHSIDEIDLTKKIKEASGTLLAGAEMSLAECACYWLKAGWGQTIELSARSPQSQASPAQVKVRPSVAGGRTKKRGK